MNTSVDLEQRRTRSFFDRFTKYIIDPRRVSHKYLLQLMLCLFVSGPTFFDNFFNACATDTMARLDIGHEQFSLLVSVPSVTGVLCGLVAGIISLYGSTLAALMTALVAFIGQVIVAYGISTSSYSTIMTGRVVFVLCWNLLGSVQKVIIFRQFTGPALACIFAMKILAIRIGAVSGLYFAGDILRRADGSLSDAMFFAVFISSVSLICTFAFAYLYRGSSTARLIRPLMIGRRRNRLDAASSGFSLSIPRDSWICCMIIFFYYGGIAPFETFGVDFLVTEYSMTRTDASQAMALIPFFSFFSPLIAPLVSSVGRQVGSLIAAQALVSISIALEMWGLPYSPHAYLCFIGIGHLVVANAVWLALAGVSPSETEKTNAASISSAMYAVSTFVFNWITGYVRDATGSYHIALVMLSALVMTGTASGVYLSGWGGWQATHSIPGEEALLPGRQDSDLEGDKNVLLHEPTKPAVIIENHFLPSTSS